MWLLSLQDAVEATNQVGLAIAIFVAGVLVVLVTGGLVLQARKDAQWAERLSAEQEDRRARLEETLHNRQN